MQRTASLMSLIVVRVSKHGRHLFFFFLIPKLCNLKSEDVYVESKLARAWVGAYRVRI